MGEKKESNPFNNIAISTKIESEKSRHNNEMEGNVLEDFKRFKDSIDNLEKQVELLRKPAPKIKVNLNKSTRNNKHLSILIDEINHRKQ